jgi:hypothetical protein
MSLTSFCEALNHPVTMLLSSRCRQDREHWRQRYEQPASRPAGLGHCLLAASGLSLDGVLVFFVVPLASSSSVRCVCE